MTTPQTRESMTYKLGKIYQIQPIIEHDEGDIYIGSTCCKYLSQRMKAHRKEYKYWKEGKTGLVTSFCLFEKYGTENCQILLIENVNCENINELKAREAYYIRTLKCVNKVIPLRTRQEYYEYNKDKIAEYKKKWSEDNKDKIKEYKKENYEKNKDDIKEKHKEYRDANKAKIAEKHKEYREKNKVAIKEKKRLEYQAKKVAIAEKSRLKRQAKKEAEIKT